MNKKNYFIAETYGMCGGVHAALKTLEDLVAVSGQDIYVFHELVHNRAVTESFVQRGVRFVKDIADFPSGATLVIGAHGVAPDEERILRAKAGICRDTTCPLVKKLHNIAGNLTENDELIVFGKPGHPEVRGVVGSSSAGRLFVISAPEEVFSLPELKNPVFISQTTVDHEDVQKALILLKKRFPNLRECSGICDASWKRQQAVIALAEKVDSVLVIGSDHSSNAKRLREIAERCGVRAYLIDNVSEIIPEMIAFSRIGITGGASTPQYLVDKVIAYLEKSGFIQGDA